MPCELFAHYTGIGHFAVGHLIDVHAILCQRAIVRSIPHGLWIGATEDPFTPSVEDQEFEVERFGAEHDVEHIVEAIVRSILAHTVVMATE